MTNKEWWALREKGWLKFIVIGLFRIITFPRSGILWGRVFIGHKLWWAHRKKDFLEFVMIGFFILSGIVGIILCVLYYLPT